MDLRQLGYVVAIVDHGGFTKAAAAVHVAQPSLSQAVRALEAELGAELFHRTGRSVVLTAAGEALIGPARRALRDAANARAAVEAVAGLRAGHLDLVCLPTLAVDPVAAAVGRFRRLHPEVTVRVAEPEDPSAVAERVRQGESEIGITELPVPADGLVTASIEVQTYVAIVPVVPGDAPPARLALRSLAARPLVTSPSGTSTRRQLDAAFDAAGLTPTVAVETDHRESFAPLVAAGAGVAVLPSGVADAVRPDGVAAVPIVPALRREVGLLHRDGPLSPAAEAFVAIALDRPAPAPRRPRPRRRSSRSGGATGIERRS